MYIDLVVIYKPASMYSRDMPGDKLGQTMVFEVEQSLSMKASSNQVIYTDIDYHDTIGQCNVSAVTPYFLAEPEHWMTIEQNIMVTLKYQQVKDKINVYIESISIH